MDLRETKQKHKKPRYFGRGMIGGFLGTSGFAEAGRSGLDTGSSALETFCIRKSYKNRKVLTPKTFLSIYKIDLAFDKQSTTLNSCIIFDLKPFHINFTLVLF